MKTIIHCRGIVTGQHITHFYTATLQDSLNLAASPEEAIKVMNARKEVQVKRPLLVLIQGGRSS